MSSRGLGDVYKRQTEGAAKATKDYNSELKIQESNLIRGRYALYDVATTYAAVAAATLGAVTATGVFAARYESAFTEIERTTLTASGAVSANIEGLRQEFLDLSEQIPLTFTELTLSLIHISEPTRRHHVSRMPSSA